MVNGFVRAFVIFMTVIGAGASVYSASAAFDKAGAGARFESLVADAKAGMLVDPSRTIVRAEAAERTAHALSGRARIVAIATAQWLQGEAHVRLNDTAAAQPLIDHAIALVATGGPPTKLNGDLLLSRGGLMSAKADVAGALAAYQAAHDVFRKIGDTRSRAIAIVMIGLLYQEAEDYEHALRYFKQSLDIYQADPQMLFSIYSNRGISLQELHRLPEAQVQFRKALDIARSLNSAVLRARTLRNIARVQLRAGQIDAADRTIALGFAVSRGDDGASSGNHFLVLSAWAAMLHGRLPDAERLISRAFGNVDPATSTLDLREGHKLAYDIFKRSGDQAQALVHLEALKKLDDQTSRLAASANTSLAAARFDFANQALNIEKLKRAELQRNVDDTRLRARTQAMVFGGAGVVSVVVVAMLAFGLVTIRRSRNEVRDANVDLGEINTALGKALAAKTEFLATTSHEIRTPLNGILGMTQVMLADDTLGAALRDRIGVVHGAGVTMRALVDDILDVAKMETGNLTIERVPFDLKATLHDVSRMWAEQARGRGLTFTLDLEDCPEFVEGDAARVRQIAFNLLSNALKFTEAGGVTLRASATGATLAIAAIDNGIGIPRDKLDMIFESFRQVDAGTTRKFGGTGLGLAICRNLARAMEGDVTVTSEPGTGSTFTLELPLVLAVAHQTVAMDAATEPCALLILDRNPISRSMLRAVLEPHTCGVVFASTLDETVARVSAGGVATVLIDSATLLAAGDVDTALAVLGRLDTTTALLWPAPSAADRARFLDCGIDRVIAKPIAGAALAAAVFDPPQRDDSTPFQVGLRAA